MGCDDPSRLNTARPCQTWLLDNVYAVRDSMTQKLREIVQLFGLPWAVKKIIPRLVNMGTEKAYLARLTTVFALQVGREDSFLDGCQMPPYNLPRP